MSAFDQSLSADAGPTGFRPPSADQVERLLRRCEPSAPSKLTAWLPAAGLIVLLLIVFQSPHGAALVGAWLLLLAWLGYTMHTARRRLSLERRAAEIHELTLLRRFPQALRRAWTLLPQLSTRGDLHGRVVAAMGHGLEQVGACDAALLAYDFLIRRVPADHPGARPIRMQRVFALLASDRLADADDELRRLRDLADVRSPGPLSAAFAFAQLWQMVATNHFEDAMALRGRLVDRLRPLGVEAGYAYALMAHAVHHAPLGVTTDDQDRSMQAQTWWHRATLLLSPSALLGRLPVLEPTAATLVPTPLPPELAPADGQSVAADHVWEGGS